MGGLQALMALFIVGALVLLSKVMTSGHVTRRLLIAFVILAVVGVVLLFQIASTGS